jgi:hypothetical protein
VQVNFANKKSAKSFPLSRAEFGTVLEILLPGCRADHWVGSLTTTPDLLPCKIIVAQP